MKSKIAIMALLTTAAVGMADATRNVLNGYRRSGLKTRVRSSRIGAEAGHMLATITKNRKRNKMARISRRKNR